MTTTATPTAPPGSRLELLQLATFHSLSVEGYHQMIALGIYPEGEPLELIEGLVIQKMSRGTAHDEAMDFLDRALAELVPAGWFVRSQRAVTLPDSEPEPDYAIVRGERVRNRGRHPLATEVGVVVEVSNTSLSLDRNHKSRVYARAGIPVYWIVNVIDKQIEVLTDPSGPTDAPAYGTTTIYTAGQQVPLALDGNTVGHIPVGDVFG
jgi:Uma2 family endonuclease